MDCSCVCYFCHLAKIAIADFVGAEHLVIFNLAMAFERVMRLLVLLCGEKAVADFVWV